MVFFWKVRMGNITAANISCPLVADCSEGLIPQLKSNVEKSLLFRSVFGRWAINLMDREGQNSHKCTLARKRLIRMLEENVRRRPEQLSWQHCTSHSCKNDAKISHVSLPAASSERILSTLCHLQTRLHTTITLKRRDTPVSRVCSWRCFGQSGYWQPHEELHQRQAREEGHIWSCLTLVSHFLF